MSRGARSYIGAGRTRRRSGFRRLSAGCHSCSTGDSAAACETASGGGGGARDRRKAATVAIAGQPNCGKTSIFNQLTGARQYVGNWAGVTVEKKAGSLSLGGGVANVIDLPGSYGLIPCSVEEEVTRSFLSHASFDLALNVVDAGLLERQLFFTLELLALGKPVVVVLTMLDELAERGKRVDTVRAGELLGCPVVAVNGRTGEGMQLLRDTVDGVLHGPVRAGTRPRLAPGSVANAVDAGERVLRAVPSPRLSALLWLLGDVESRQTAAGLGNGATGRMDGIRDELEESAGLPAGRAVTDWIYGSAKGIARECTRSEGVGRMTRERITVALDSLALHPYGGVLLFFAVLFGMFELTFKLGDLIISLLDNGFAWIGHLLSGIPVPWLASLLNDGLLGGVGNVFLVAPYVFLMFLFLSFLEDSGYMARAAYIMDRFMHRLGLHGKAFIPLVLGFGCNVPAIMAARSLDSRNDRLKTILMTPFMSCSARLAVYVFLGGAFFGQQAGLVVFALYVGGIGAGLLTAFLLSKTLLKGSSEGLIMELPPYRLPRVHNLFLNTWNKLREYFQKAGSLILLLSLVVWALSYFPTGATFGGKGSLIGMLGAFVAPALAPLHFNAAMTVGLIAGFTAKEVVIATLGVISGAGAAGLQAALPSMMTASTALAYLVFVLLYTPCLAAVAVIRSETGSSKWTVVSVVYGVVLAYLAALAVRAAATLLGA